MNLLSEYEFESLPYIDNEYDHPIVSELVHSMIASEMKTFTPDERLYLAHLPYPSLKFSNSVALQQEFARIKAGKPMLSEKIGLKQSLDPPPDGPLQKDVQAWRKAVAHAKTQHEHQITRAINIEASSEAMKDQWLSFNSNLDNISKSLGNDIESKKRKIAEINTVRRVAQEKVAAELERSLKRRNNAVDNQTKIIAACRKMLSSYPEEKQDEILLSCLTTDDVDDEMT
jgi:hypothetical protein